MCYKAVGAGPEGEDSEKSRVCSYNFNLIDEENEKSSFVRAVLSDTDIDVKSILVSDLVDYTIFESVEWGEAQPVQWQSNVNISADFCYSEEWLKGFGPQEGSEKDNWRWCSDAGELKLINITEETLFLDMEVSFSTGNQSFSDLRIKSSLFDGPQIMSINNVPQHMSKKFALPAGAHSIKFYCNAPGTKMPGDSRDLVFRIHNFKLYNMHPNFSI